MQATKVNDYIEYLAIFINNLSWEKSVKNVSAKATKLLAK